MPSAVGLLLVSMITCRESVDHAILLQESIVYFLLCSRKNKTVMEVTQTDSRVAGLQSSGDMAHWDSSASDLPRSASPK